MEAIGVMPMPADFRYREVFLRGRPQHERYDEFGVRHPKMSRAKRAKIFAPYDALAGFSDAVAAKNVPYVEQVEPEEQDREELDRRLNILHALTFNGRMAKANRVEVTLRFYVPCADKNNFAFGLRGLYETVTGVCRGVDPDLTRTIRVGGRAIALDSIVSVESPSGAFDRVPESKPRVKRVVCEGPRRA